MKRLLLLIFLLLWPSAVRAAAIHYTFAEQNSPQTITSATFADITGAAIASGNFTEGKKYLLLVTAQYANTTATNPCGVQVLHGSTAFADSEDYYDPANTTERRVYAWMDVWTAVAGEGIKLQGDSNGTDSCVYDQIAIAAINLSDDVTENTDWIYANHTTDDAITGSLDGASITFTPGGASNWWVLSCTQHNNSVTNDGFDSGITRSGEASSTDPIYADFDALGNSNPISNCLSRPYALTAEENIFTEVTNTGVGTVTRLNSKIFAINLAKFAASGAVYTAADANLSATDYATELATTTITPTVTGDVLMFAWFGWDKNNSARELEFRLQVDGTDQPAGQTTDNYQIDSGSGDSSQEQPIALLTVGSLSNASHTLDVDASSDSTTGTPAGQHRSIVAFTMELAAETETPLVGQLRRRIQ
jgi:hypothetical protein